jgi:hypothetical protein
MRYTCETTLNLPRDRVAELFDSTENLKKWMKGLVSFDHLSGEPGQPGAKSKLVFEMGKRRMEMIETITVRNLPDEFDGTYDAKGVHNIVRNRFIERAGQTVWQTDSEFQFKGLMKLMGALMPGAFRKETEKHMANFKAFAESQG